MINKSEALAGGLGRSGGFGKALAKIEDNIRHGILTSYFYPSEIPAGTRGFVSECMRQAGWNCSVTEEKVNGGDYTGSQWVDRLKVEIS